MPDRECEGSEGDTGESRILRFLQWSGVDRGVGYSLLNRGWSILAYPITLYMVTTFFSRELQGYYFTFNNLLMFQAVVEMGVGTVLVQFVSHEWARLRLGDSGWIEGEADARSRLASLLRMGFKWYLGSAALFLAVAGIPGHFLLSRHGQEPGILPAWWMLCLTVALSFPLIPMRSALEGSDRVGKSQAIVLAAGISSSAAGWVAIMKGAGLYVPFIVNAVLLMVNALLLVPAFRPYFRLLRNVPSAATVSWKEEFWPQQWRIAFSWFCGYVMFYSFVPIVYYLHGPVEAGIMGAALSLFHATNLFGTAWVYPVAPKMGMLAYHRKIEELRGLVRVTELRSMVAAFLAAIGAMTALILLKHLQFPQADRFGDYWPISVFLLVAVLLQISNVETQAIRFQKKEPFMKISALSAAFVMLSALLLGKTLGIGGIVTGFAGTMVLYLLPSVHFTYRAEMDKVSHR